jgi:predicted dehydrogenase
MSISKEQGADMSRRGFMQASAFGAAALSLGAKAVRAQDVEPLRVGLVGCGKRGTGAARDCVQSSPEVYIAAMGDIFPDQLATCRTELANSLGKNYTATDDTCFSGWDAFEKVIACEVDYIILAAPPAFRPQHLAACIDAGKHVFMEKPVAVDPIGVRSILASSAKATEKSLGIVAGNQRRHQAPYVELVKRIHDGAIGEVLSAECYWIGDYDYYPAVLKQEAWTDMEWQLRNWNYFTWLSGDHIVEQHVHNIDIMNWVFQGPPKKAIGMGGRQQRTAPEYGHIFDHFAVEFEYDNDVRVTSLCRQMTGTVNRVGEHVVGTKGICNPAKSIMGENRYVFDGEQISPYVQEHADLIASIRAGKPLNEARAIAESTLTAIMGRMAAYTGQEVTWKFVAEESTLDLTPPAYEFGPLPVPPVAIPGETELV